MEKERSYDNATTFNTNGITQVNENKQSGDINLYSTSDNLALVGNNKDYYDDFIPTYITSDNSTENKIIKMEPSFDNTNYYTDTERVCECDSTEEKKVIPVVKTSKNGKFPCTFCVKAFAKKQQLQNHVKTHTKEKNFKCEVCEKCFIHKQQLMNHQKIHAGSKDFQCTFCDKCFMLKQQLQIHTKTHTGEKNFACTMCDKAFITKQQLQNHMNSHLGIKPFTCDECQKQFAHKQQLDRHKKNHSIKQNHLCKHCDAKFLSKTAFNMHVKELHMDDFIKL